MTYRKHGMSDSLITIIRKVWQQRCANEHDYYLKSWQRWWYALKVTICLIANREIGRKLQYDDDRLLVAVLDSGTSWSEYGTAHWWFSVDVGWGYRRGWWFTFESDSSI